MLLKAFSLFKKRQRSSWKLLLAGEFASHDKGFSNLLQTYKYKDDIVLPGALEQEEEAQVVASSYAAIAAGERRAGAAILCALKCGIPCLAGVGNGLKNEEEGGLLTIDTSDPVSIAEALMLLYKDELLHARLAGEALLIASSFTPQKTANLVWQSLQQTAGTT